MLHGIGKSYQTRLLYKPHVLTNEEYDEIKQTSQGHPMLEPGRDSYGG